MGRMYVYREWFPTCSRKNYSSLSSSFGGKQDRGIERAPEHDIVGYRGGSPWSGVPAWQRPGHGRCPHRRPMETPPGMSLPSLRIHLLFLSYFISIKWKKTKKNCLGFQLIDCSCHLLVTRTQSWNFLNTASFWSWRKPVVFKPKSICSARYPPLSFFFFTLT